MLGSDDAPPAGPVLSVPRERGRRRVAVRAAISRVPGWVVVLVLVLVLALVVLSAVLSAQATDTDSGYDLTGLLRAVLRDILRLRWQFVAIVGVLAAAHYLAAAFAARAAAGIPLRLGETFLVQLTAAAANRLTPAGLGGAAVNTRFYLRRGLPLAEAVGAVAALKVGGAVSDILVLAGLAGAGWLFGLGGVHAETSLLAHKLSGYVSPLHSWWALLAAGVALALALAARRYLASRDRVTLRRVWEPMTRLRHRPAALLILLGASGCTTMLLAFAFAASTAMVPGPQPHIATGGLLIGFMLGSAASNAIPTPAGVGATETALVLVLTTAAVPATHAVEVVIIFRVITFWIPALLGLLATRHLRRRGAL